MSSFDHVLMKTIEDVLTDVFEGEVTKVILDYIHENKKENIDEKVQALSEALPNVLGSGAVIIQDLIVENLYSRYGQTPEWKKEYGFRDYIMNLSQTSAGRNAK